MKTIVVLGMHRSATSLVARGLDNEINMGPRINKGPGHTQPKGHYESIDFTDLNAKIIREAGGAWDRPPPEEAILAAGKKLEDEIKELVDRSGDGKEIWGWKDPRTALTVRCYLPFLQNPHFVAIFRDPSEVAKSLNRRHGKDETEKWVALAKEYNRRIFEFLQEFVR